MTNEEKALVWYKARKPDVYLANPTWVSRDLAAYAEEQTREIAAYAAGLKAALEQIVNHEEGAELSLRAQGVLLDTPLPWLAQAQQALTAHTPEAAALAAAAMEVGHAYVGWMHRTSGEDPVEYGRLERILDDADERYLAIREKAKS